MARVRIELQPGMGLIPMAGGRPTVIDVHRGTTREALAAAVAGACAALGYSLTDLQAALAGSPQAMRPPSTTLLLNDPPRPESYP